MNTPRKKPAGSLAPTASPGEVGGGLAGIVTGIALLLGLDQDAAAVLALVAGATPYGIKWLIRAWASKGQ